MTSCYADAADEADAKATAFLKTATAAQVGYYSRVFVK
jgi:hypothetical protein